MAKVKKKKKIPGKKVINLIPEKKQQFHISKHELYFGRYNDNK
jgi:hypothetical protein